MEINGKELNLLIFIKNLYQALLGEVAIKKKAQFI